jgi:hypothetical protein
MYARLFDSAAHLLLLPIVALFMFIAIFATVVARTMGRKAATYSGLAALPLAQEDKSS